MKFTVNSHALHKAIKPLSALAKPSATVPICENFLCDLSPDGLTITATDLQTTLRVNVEVDTRATHRFCIPAAKLLAVLAVLPEQPLTVKFHGPDNHGVELISESGRYRISGENPIDFPKTPEVVAGTALTVSAEVLFRGITIAGACTSNDHLRPAMTGLLFSIGAEGVRFVATDGHKLARYTHSGTKHETATECLIPRKAVEILRSLLPLADEGVIAVSLSKMNALFEIGSGRLITRLIDEKFPDYDNAIPKNTPHTVSFNLSEYRTAIKRVSLLEGEMHHIRHQFAAGKLTLTSEDLDYGNEAVESLALDWTGDTFDITFQSNQLLTLTAAIHERMCSFQLVAPNRAALLVPEVASNEEITLLIMPCVVSAYA